MHWKKWTSHSTAQEKKGRRFRHNRNSQVIECRAAHASEENTRIGGVESIIGTVKGPESAAGIEGTARKILMDGEGHLFQRGIP